MISQSAEGPSVSAETRSTGGAHAGLAVLIGLTLALTVGIAWWPLEFAPEALDSALSRVAGLAPDVNVFTSARELLFNVMLFVPLGAAVSVRWGSLVGIGIVGLCVSAIVECGQLMMWNHVVSVGDMGANTLGAVLGGSVIPAMERTRASEIAGRAPGTLVAGIALLPVTVVVISAQAAYGSFSTWDKEFPLNLGNETSGERAWDGTIERLVFESGTYTWSASNLELVPRAGKMRSLESHREGWISDHSLGRQISSAVRRTGEFTVQADVRPASPEQSGPARIVSISQGHEDANFMLGQSGRNLIVRVRRALSHGGGTQPFYEASDVLSAATSTRVRVTATKRKLEVLVNGEERVLHRYDLPTQWWTQVPSSARWRPLGPWGGLLAASGFFWLLLMPVSSGLSTVDAMGRRRLLAVTSGVGAVLSVIVLGVWLGTGTWASVLCLPAVLAAQLWLTSRVHSLRSGGRLAASVTGGTGQTVAPPEREVRADLRSPDGSVRSVGSRSPATKKILEIGNYPPPYCGWSVRTQYLARAVREAGAECRVLDIGPGRKQRREGCIDVQNGRDYLIKLIRHAARGYRFHVHVNGDSPKGLVLAFAALIVGAFSGRRGVLTFHAGVNQRFFPRRSRPWRLLFWSLFTLPAAVVCNSEPVRQEILRYSDRPGRVHAIPAFSEQYLTQGKSREDLPDDVEAFCERHALLLMCYAYDRPEFMLEQLVRVFGRVLETGEELPGLLVVGDPNGYPELEQLVRSLALSNHVHFSGNLPRPQFLAALEQADVYVRTHLRDGVSSSVLEALAHNTIVVAADNESRPERVLTYDGLDPKGLEEALRAAMDGLGQEAPSVAPPDGRSEQPSVRDTLASEVEVLLAPEVVSP